MEVDNTTYNDLSVFHSEEESSIFHKLDMTRTAEGSEWLMRFFKSPFSDLRLIRETQEIVRVVHASLGDWPASISNGTIMVITKFFDSNIDAMPSSRNLVNAVSYKVFHSADFSLVRYSLTHFADFLRGMKQLVNMFGREEMPPSLRRSLLRASDLISKETPGELAAREAGKPFSYMEILRFGRFIKYEYRSQTHELIDIFGRLDAWYSMALAMERFRLTFPVFSEAAQPFIHARGLYHVLLHEPVPYDIGLNIDSNFIFLTGANMAGKSTFIKAVGSAVFLAHLGMGVPAEHMELTVFDGLLSNINVVDNIMKGESYFFNEVQRIKKTIVKINDGRHWLVLIDELFKGTNVQDAMKCSAAVIRGLIKIRNSLFILSTHLYEIGEELKQYPNISFKYFETSVAGDQLSFGYRLKEGISNDRIGYLILKREKVVEMLDRL